MKIRSGFVSNSSSSSFIIKRESLSNSLIEELNGMITNDFCKNNIKTNINLSKDYIRFSRWYTKGLQSFEERFPRGEENDIYQYYQESHYKMTHFGKEVFMEFDNSLPLSEVIAEGDKKFDKKYGELLK